MGAGMLRALKIAVVVMGVMIVGGTATLVVLIVQRVGGKGNPVPAVSAAALLYQLDEPSGTAIASIAMGPDRLAIQLRGGGPDRVVLVDPRSGAMVARIALTH